MKNKNLLYIGIALAALIGLPIAYYLLSPLWINVRVDESLPAAADPVLTQLPASAEPSQPDGAHPVALAQGSFYGLIHRGSGQAILYQLEDGSRILRLQEFEVDNGPDLYVYLVPIDPVPSAVGSEIESSFNLGRLKGNIGDQNYDIPADLDLSQFKSVVIWCKSFAVPFSAAPLTAP